MSFSIKYYSNIIHLILLLNLIITILSATSSTANNAKKKVPPACAKVLKMQLPPKVALKGQFITCTDNGSKKNMFNNFVWPMESTEKIYFFVKGFFNCTIFTQIILSR